MQIATAKWRFNIGCHNGSPKSRESQCDVFDSREDAVAEYQEAKVYFNSIGYRVWFAKLYAPNGTMEFLDKGDE